MKHIREKTMLIELQVTANIQKNFLITKMVKHILD